MSYNTHEDLMLKAKCFQIAMDDSTDKEDYKDVLMHAIKIYHLIHKDWE